MKQAIFLIVDKWRVKRMTKTLGQTYKGELPIKVNVKVADNAYNKPTLERDIIVEDWTGGVDLSDVELERASITEDEAKLIRQSRLAHMKEVLEQEGYRVEETASETEPEIKGFTGEEAEPVT